MATTILTNKQDLNSKQIHGLNPQELFDKILRNRIYNTPYWKEHCFGLTPETIIDKAIELKYIGGTFGKNKAPTNFICLVYKLIQIQPEDEIILEYLNNSEYKYLTALAAFYIRLTFRHKFVYKTLEPLYNDYRKLRAIDSQGNFYITHVDEFVDNLIVKPELFDITFPLLPKRRALELNENLSPRVSVLEADLDLKGNDADILKNINIDYEESFQETDEEAEEELDNRGKKEGERMDLEDEEDDGRWKKAADIDFRMKEDKFENFNKRTSYGRDEMMVNSDEEKGEERKKKKKEKKEKKEKKRKEKERSRSRSGSEHRRDDSISKLDPESDEYWLALRKKAGLK